MSLAERTEVELSSLDDELDDAERARLHAARDEADEELRAGKGIPGERIVSALRRGEL
jgi:hypothetical protein